MTPDLHHAVGQWSINTLQFSENRNLSNTECPRRTVHTKLHHPIHHEYQILLMFVALPRRCSSTASVLVESQLREVLDGGVEDSICFAQQHCDQRPAVGST